MARILVVDDDPAILKLAERILSASGHSVVGAENALRAMELLNSCAFDLLLSDANMPHYSGFDLIRTVKNNRSFQNMAVAMLTGRKEKKDIEQAVKLGVDDYIVKPFDPVLVLQKIEALLEKKPPQPLPEVRFTPEAPSARGRAYCHLQLVSVSELGIGFVTSVRFEIHDVVEAEAPFLKDLGTPTPPLKVIEVRQDSESAKWLVNTVYLGAQESFLKKIRAWIITHGSSLKAAS